MTHSSNCPGCHKPTAGASNVVTFEDVASLHLTKARRKVTRTWHGECFDAAEASAAEYRAQVEADHRAVMESLRAGL